MRMKLLDFNLNLLPMRLSLLDLNLGALLYSKIFVDFLVQGLEFLDFRLQRLMGREFLAESRYLVILSFNDLGQLVDLGCSLSKLLIPNIY